MVAGAGVGWLMSQRAEESDVFRGVAQMILAANDVGDVHFQIIDHIHKMKYRLAVRPDDDKVGIALFAIGQLAFNVADHEIVEMLERDPDPSSATVVTSDRALAERVRALGATVMSAGSFRRRLDEWGSGEGDRPLR